MGCSSNAIWAIEFQNSNIQIKGLQKAKDFSSSATASAAKGLEGRSRSFLRSLFSCFERTLANYLLLFLFFLFLGLK